MILLITDLDKAVVLLSLYNHAKLEGPAFDGKDMSRLAAKNAKNGTLEAAQAFLKKRGEDLCIDYIDLGGGLRPIKMDLSGLEIDSKKYDLCNGKGLANKVIDGIRLPVVNEEEKDKSEALIAMFARMTAKVLEGDAHSPLAPSMKP